MEYRRREAIDRCRREQRWCVDYLERHVGCDRRGATAGLEDWFGEEMILMQRVYPETYFTDADMSRMYADAIRQDAIRAGIPVPHTCGAIGYGMNPNDACPACEDSKAE
jgi:hypothetical protein